MFSKKSFIALLGAAIILGIATVGAYAWYLLQPMDQNNQTATQFVIPKGQSITTIGKRLEEAGLIKHGVVFRVVVTQKGLSGKIQAGSFDISPSMTIEEIALTLTQGTEDLWITILEGWRAEEIAEYLDAQELGSYDSEQFLHLVEQNDTEGQLFPDTYLIPRESTAQQIYTLLTNTFDAKVLDELQEEISTSERPFDQVLIMASLVEREARDFEQMRHVAGILWHRIELGMALQVDATLQYSIGKKAGATAWWVPPTAADKATQSPFNTYLYPGLPPRPISNPSLNAIKAALDPLQVDDVFYLHAPSGDMYFAKTLDEHNVNINRYLR